MAKITSKHLTSSDRNFDPPLSPSCYQLIIPHLLRPSWVYPHLFPTHLTSHTSARPRTIHSFHHDLHPSIKSSSPLHSLPTFWKETGPPSWADPRNPSIPSLLGPSLSPNPSCSRHNQFPPRILRALLIPTLYRKLTQALWQSRLLFSFTRSGLVLFARLRQLDLVWRPRCCKQEDASI